jgi:hypothetical protein
MPFGTIGCNANRPEETASMSVAFDYARYGTRGYGKISRNAARLAETGSLSTVGLASVLCLAES